MNQAIVIDLGTATIKAGITTTFTILTTKDIEADLSASFTKIYGSPQEAIINPVLFAVNPLETNSYRDKLAEIMFSTYCAPALSLQDDAVLPLYHAGLKTGVVLDMGNRSCRATPVYEGVALTKCTQANNLSSKTLTELLTFELTKPGMELSFSTMTEKNQGLVDGFKTTYCYACPDLKKEEDSFRMKLLTAGDRKITPVSASVARFKVPEALFNPSIYEQTKEEKSISWLVHEAVRASPNPMLSTNQRTCNLVLAGGTSEMRRVEDRLKLELNNKTYPEYFKQTVTNLLQDSQPSVLSQIPMEVRTLIGNYGAPPTYQIHGQRTERLKACWLGGIVVARTLDNWITREQYLEVGPSVLSRKM